MQTYRHLKNNTVTLGTIRLAVDYKTIVEVPPLKDAKVPLWIFFGSAVFGRRFLTWIHQPHCLAAHSCALPYAFQRDPYHATTLRTRHFQSIGWGIAENAATTIDDNWRGQRRWLTESIGRRVSRDVTSRRCALGVVHVAFVLPESKVDYEQPHFSTTIPGNRENTIWYSLSKYSIVISDSFLGAQHGPVLFGGSARLTICVFG